MERLLLFAWLGVLSACGDTESPARSGGSAGGSSGAGGAAAVGGAASGGSAGSGGVAGSAGSGVAGSGVGGSGMLAGQCAGSFASLATVFPGEPNMIPGGLSITADDLELYYGHDMQVFVRKRASKAEAFSVAALVLDLSTECMPLLDQTPNPSVDVSGDGLRMYISCNDAEAPLRFASRPDRNAGFVLAAETLGNVGASISISSDELVAYSATSNAGDPLVLRSQRASTSEPFSAAVRVAEISGVFRHPEISQDSLNLFGLLRVEPIPPSTSEAWRLAVATRPSPEDAFSQPSTAGLPVPAADQSYFSPTVSGDCSSLYFVTLTGPVLPQVSEVGVATR